MHFNMIVYTVVKVVGAVFRIVNSNVSSMVEQAFGPLCLLLNLYQKCNVSLMFLGNNNMLCKLPDFNIYLIVNLFMDVLKLFLLRYSISSF